jgi:hypothetical protein
MKVVPQDFFKKIENRMTGPCWGWFSASSGPRKGSAKSQFPGFSPKYPAFRDTSGAANVAR